MTSGSYAQFLLVWTPDPSGVQTTFKHGLESWAGPGNEAKYSTRLYYPSLVPRLVQKPGNEANIIRDLSKASPVLIFHLRSQ